jgi:hypothetical protein
MLTFFNQSQIFLPILFQGVKADEKVSLANATYLRTLLVSPATSPTGSCSWTVAFWSSRELPRTCSHEHEGIFFARGYNGTGVARASWLGHKVLQGGRPV